MPFKTAFEREGVAPVSVDIHITWIELKNGNGTFVGHEIVSTEVILPSSRRRASIAV